MTIFGKGSAQRLGIGLVCATAIVAGCTPRATSNAPVEIRGTDPNAAAKRAGPNTLNNAVIAAPDGNGIVTYDGYQSAIAQNGDTVTTVADRIGLSASELGAYNGLPASHRLRAGDELVLPPRPGGYGDAGGTTSLTAPVQSRTANTAPQTTTIQQTPLAQTQAPASVVTTPSVDPNLPAARPADATWSPDIAAAAINRSTGIKQDGTLGAPPSASDPIPPEPAKRRDLASPDLGQYQTGVANTAAPADPAVAPANGLSGDQLATAPQSTGLNIKLRRPVSGPVAVGFNKGSGPARNDGVDFAAKAGAPVVAAADGEVALVSQSLGGLGTIILVRHPNELLTVYGRIDGVLVNKGDILRAGQQIGIVSNAAAPAEPRMHFEVRRGAESLDPMQFL